MSRLLLTLVLFSSFQALLGCAHTRVVSQRDPNVPEGYYGSVLVDAQLASMLQSVDAEDRVAGAMRTRGYRAFAEGEVLFSRREYSPQERDALLDAKGIDAVLLIRLRDQGYESDFLPDTVTRNTEVEATEDGYTETETTTFAEDRSIELAWGEYVAELYDRRTGVLVWVAEAESKGSPARASLTGGGLDHDDLARAVAGAVARRLQEDRVLRPARDLDSANPLAAPFQPARLRRP